MDISNAVARATPYAIHLNILVFLDGPLVFLRRLHLLLTNDPSTTHADAADDKRNGSCPETGPPSRSETCEENSRVCRSQTEMVPVILRRNRVSDRRGNGKADRASQLAEDESDMSP